MENQPAIYQCGICKKNFYRDDNYNSHRRAHGYGLDCDTCKKPHPSLEDLILHIECVHGPEVGYKCDSCQKCFSQMEKLLAHLETAHNPAATTGKEYIFQFNVYFTIVFICIFTSITF